MLLGRFYFVAFVLPIRLQSYRCFHAYCHSLATFMFISFIKRSAILRFFIVLGGGGGAMLNLVFGSMFLLRGLCSALCFVCYD